MFYDNIMGNKVVEQITTNYTQYIRTHTNWDSKEADEERTIFGKSSKGLFYVYSDRLYDWNHDLATKAKENAKKISNENTAEFFALMLSYYYNCEYIQLEHIIAGCNRSNGFPYLVFGFQKSDKLQDIKKNKSYKVYKYETN